MKLSQIEINNHKKKNPGFLFYQTADEETITEWCSACTVDVKIENKAEKQTCPECGADIWPCSLCDHNRVNCAECIIK